MKTKRPRRRVQKQNVGNAGEYYVAAVLSAMNYTATITLGRAERYDILAVSPKKKAYKFSVKTRLSKESTAFTLSERDELGFENDLFYVFVRLYDFKEKPDYWVLPSKVVSKIIAGSYKKWLSDIGKRSGKRHNHTTLRKIPVDVRGIDIKYYGLGWADEMLKYKNNFRALR